jgi:Tfp pilus assembly protein PilO
MKFNINTQAQWWKYAAGTLPFIGLAIIVLLDIIGWTALHNKILFIILIGFFTSGIIWWWWAIDKIVRLTTLLINTEKKFDEIKTEINAIKQQVKSLDRTPQN